MTLALHSTMSASDDWWASLKHGGLLIAPSKLNEFFVAESLKSLPYWIEDRLRRDVTRLQNGEDEHLSTFLDTVLEDVLGLTGDWQKGSQVDRLWSYPAITREIIRPRRVWQSPQGDVLPVFVADGQEASGRVARLGIGRGKRSVSRVVEWLRQANQKIGLLTNGYQWRLIHAGADYDAWCEWDVAFWFEEGQPGLQVTALRLLLGVQALQSEQASGLSPLMAAIDASRQGQGEISEVLGERVRQAVELLIRESAESLKSLGIGDRESGVESRELGIGSRESVIESRESESENQELAQETTHHSPFTTHHSPITSRQIYIAATRIIMRCVVILFAEARDLLPRDNPIYHSAYGLQGLREQLDRRAGGRATERLRQGVSAWMRLLALFRLVDEGSAHEALPVPCYGGGLFTAGDRTSNDAILLVLYAFEHSSHPLSDAVVYRILELLCRSKVRVRQGRGSTWVEAPVDFSDLSSEYIGILYEGLLDFELRQAEVNDPVVFLNLGDQPALPLTRLQGMSDKAVATLVEKLKQKTKGEAEVEDGEESELEEEKSEESLEPESPDDSLLPDALLDDDRAIQLRQRAQQWAVRAVEVGKLVTAPRSKKPEALAAYAKAVNQAATKLIARVVLPGEWFLVRWGGTRKGSGTFYTRPQLAIPTTRQMLQPLVYLTVEDRGVEESRNSELGTLTGDDLQPVTNKDARSDDPVLPGSSGMERGNDPGGDVLSGNQDVSERGDLRDNLTDSTGGNVSSSEYSRGLRKGETGRIYPISANSPGFTQGVGNPSFDSRTSSINNNSSNQASLDAVRNSGENAAIANSLSSTERGVESREVEKSRSEEKDNSRLPTPDSPLPIPHSRLTTPHSSIPKTPEEILALKVCDPAMGSGSFLIAALRYLAEALYESLHYYDRIPLNGTQVLCRLPDGAETNLMSDRTLPVPPDHPEFEGRLKASLKRFLVEWCIYGVDIDPLAVELARLSLWVETMDRSLSFSFLDHKLKCGNSLVGCWFEQFQDYPVMAWERDGGDKDHDRFVHHFREFVVAKGKKQGQTQKSGDVWNQAIKDMKASVIRSELKEVVSGQLNLLADWSETPKQTHAHALKAYREAHLAVFNPQEQELTYRQIEEREEYKKLRQVFDTWCAVWFWSPEFLEIAPTPRKFDRLSPETARIVAQLAERHQFFHWELEFPDVFQVADSGFAAVIGNPPWEIQKPNSKEFFSNIDPLYRTYGKQEALTKQSEYFAANPSHERDWLAYCDRLKALSNWSRYVAYPFGDYADESLVGSKFSLSRSAKENTALHDLWRQERATREAGFTTRHFPFRRQGSADVNTYKLFSELGYTLARDGGRFGFITPSGIYSDKGSGRLRDLFLKRCNWTHLYAFQNERFIFGSVDHRFKMVVASVTKGSETTSIATRFRLGPGDSPEAYELVTDMLNPDGYLPVSVATILQFSPNTGALLEIRTERDLMILEKMYANGILLGDTSPQGWGIRYATEFHMTNDSKLFPPRAQWEAKGYRADEYGHWLKGEWREVESEEPGIENRESGVGNSTSELGKSGLELETSTSELGKSGLELETSTSELKLSSLELETWRSEGKPSGSELGRSSLELETSRSELGRSSLELETSRSELETSRSEPDRPTSQLQLSQLSTLTQPGVIRSADGRSVISINEVEDVALPLYQGIMMNQFDACAKAWKSGAGFQAVWETLPEDQRTLSPQYLVSRSNYFESPKVSRQWKLGYRRIARSTDSRTWIGTLISDLPAGDSIFYLVSGENKPINSLSLAAILNSYVYDWQLRSRLAGTNLSWFVLEETVGITRSSIEQTNCDELVLRLIGTTLRHSLEWQFYQHQANSLKSKRWKQLWAITPYERLRLRAILDAVVAHLYGLDTDDFAWILRDCDHPIERVNDNAIARSFDPKGFWRVDKDKPPELRHTVLSQVAFNELNAIGLEAFLNLNNGEGWMLPETLRLADYGLGNSDRANEFVPVAEKMGVGGASLEEIRFLPWQLAGTPEESWEECDRHAENLRRLLGTKSSSSSTPDSRLPTPPPQPFTPPQQLTLIQAETQQLGLFDTLEP